MNANELTIGLIGLDSSHCIALTEMLNNREHPWHVPGGRVIAAYRGGSPDLSLSSERIDSYTETIMREYGVKLMDTLEELAAEVDAVLLTSVDGRLHLEQFAAIAPLRKPVFIDKPFAISTEDARRMVALAERYGVPLMSGSSLRYSEGLTTRAMDIGTDGSSAQLPYGVDCYGPMKLEPLMPGWFWYGVHLVEMAYAVLGKGCVRVTALASEEHDAVIGEWSDGRIATLRGNRRGNNEYGCAIHWGEASRVIDIGSVRKPYYASMLESIMDMFTSGQSRMNGDEMIEVVRFMEAANESRASGESVRLW